MTMRTLHTVLGNIRMLREPLHGIEGGPALAALREAGAVPPADAPRPPQPEPEDGELIPMELVSGTIITPTAVAVSEASRKQLLEVGREHIERLVKIATGPTWRMARAAAGDRALELLVLSVIIVEELRLATSPLQILHGATALPPGTYKPETMRDLYLVAVRSLEAGHDRDMKPAQHRDHAVRELAGAWKECTGKKATASFDQKDQCEGRAGRFGEFAEVLLNDSGFEISLRQIRSALYPTDQKTH